MKETVLLMAGTTEGRELAQALCGRGLRVIACTATEYGGELLPRSGDLEILEGRLDKQDLSSLIRREQVTLVLDATHPYARAVTENLREACTETGTEYLRILRESTRVPDAVWVETAEDAARYLSAQEGNILLTVGAKELPAYCSIPDFASRVYARVLPMERSLAACREAGLSGSHIIAMQGPFSEELNTALLRQFGIRWMVTKDGGIPGGMPEKAAAARNCSVSLLILGRPPEQDGALTLSEALHLLETRFPARKAARRKIFLISAGMGSRETLTVGGWDALCQSQCIFGARRLTESDWLPAHPKFPVYQPEKIQDILFSHPEWQTVAILLSGDIGFWSGADKLRSFFSGDDVVSVPGVGTVQYFSARIGIPWQDLTLVSLHGRDGDPVTALQKSAKVLFLTGGENTPARICRQLTEHGFGLAKVWIGERLSYPDEKITAGTAGQFSDVLTDSLAAMVVFRD